MKNIEKFKPKTNKRNLFFLAGLVWAIAGYNVLKIGVDEFGSMDNFRFISLILGLMGFALFFSKVFYKMFKKHSKRIVNMENESPCLFSFFDKKGYLIMAFMMTFGISLRVFNLISGIALVIIYTAIGLSLSLSAISFFLAGINYENTVKKHSIL
ncbi:hypothetical protein [Peptacetobacter sp.]|uniref:hypothetical protein n=1 Tax=Peptacetobacter sp. TaxID=2991975 RepID=UPI00260E2740|nr:hypothetical protein [Peptacetobacter sp.]